MSFEDRQYKCQVDIDAAPSGTSSDVTVVFTEDMLPSQMFDADGVGPAQSDFGDVAIYGSSDGSGRFSLDVVESTTDNDPANGTCEVNARDAASLYVWSSVAVNPVYVAWHTASTSTQPAASATYGSDAAYASDVAAWWTFNGDPSGSAPQLVDRTSNSNDGTTSGSMTSGDLVDGQVGKAWDFDGTDDVATVPSDVSLPDGADERHWRAWFYLDGSNADDRIMSQGGSSTNGERLDINIYNGKIAVEFVGHVRGFGSALSTSTWYLVDVLVPSGATSTADVVLYLDGTLQSETDTLGSAQTLNTTATDLTFGREQWGTSFYLDGRIGSSMVASAASSADISFHYNNTSDPAAFASVGTPELTYAGTVFDVGTPTAYYRLGESSGTTANDVSGNGYDSNYDNTPTLGATGLLGGDADTAVTFDSASSEKITVPGATKWGTLGSSLGSGISVAFAFSTSATTASHVVINAGQSTGTNTKLLIYYDAVNDKFVVRLDDDNGDRLWGETPSSLGVNDGNANYFVCTVNPGSDAIAVYVDDDSKTITYTYQETPSVFGDFTTTTTMAGAGSTDFFDGTLDEISIHNKVLNSTEAGELFTAAGLATIITGTLAAISPAGDFDATMVFNHEGTIDANAAAGVFAGNLAKVFTGEIAQTAPAATFAASMVHVHTGVFAPAAPSASFAGVGYYSFAPSFQIYNQVTGLRIGQVRAADANEFDVTSQLGDGKWSVGVSYLDGYGTESEISELDVEISGGSLVKALVTPSNVRSYAEAGGYVVVVWDAIVGDGEEAAAEFEIDDGTSTTTVTAGNRNRYTQQIGPYTTGDTIRPRIRATDGGSDASSWVDVPAVVADATGPDAPRIVT